MLSDYRLQDIEKRIDGMRPRSADTMILDVMLLGGTGTGKSTTLNSLLGSESANVGHGFEPETMDISAYKLNKIVRFWDTPGLGDSAEQDKSHAKKIADKLHESYAMRLSMEEIHEMIHSYNSEEMLNIQLGRKKFGFIDLVLVVIDGSTRDLGTVYTLFVDVLLPNIQADRILTVINQCDMAMSGRHWDYSRNVPDSTLLDFLNDQVRTITRRISETTGKNIIPPVYYSAEYGYNIERVLDLIIDHIPLERRKI